VAYPVSLFEKQKHSLILLGPTLVRESNAVQYKDAKAKRVWQLVCHATAVMYDT